MKRFLIMSHGHMASGIKSSVEILTGPCEAIAAIDCYVDDSDYVPAVRDFIEGNAKGDESVIFTDILGGSVFQKVIQERPETHGVMHVTGTNLAVVIECLLTGDRLTPEKVSEIATQASGQLKLITIDEGRNDGDPSDVAAQENDFFA